MLCLIKFTLIKLFFYFLIVSTNQIYYTGCYFPFFFFFFFFIHFFSGSALFVIKYLYQQPESGNPLIRSGKIRSGHGILIYSAWQRVNTTEWSMHFSGTGTHPIFFFFFLCATLILAFKKLLKCKVTLKVLVCYHSNRIFSDQHMKITPMIILFSTKFYEANMNLIGVTNIHASKLSSHAS